MANVLLIVHLILAVFLIAVVLLQRSEGGALGIGGGGGGGGVVSNRGAATALSKITWVLGGAFIVTSIWLTVLDGGRSDGSVIGAEGEPELIVPGTGFELPPPDAPVDGGLLPPPPTE